MKTIVAIPMASYQSILSRFPIKSPEYALLKNGVVTEQGGSQVVNILCDEKRADNLCYLINRISPEFISAIHKVTLPHDS